MHDYSHRSLEKELLDSRDIPFEDIKLTMQELDSINSLLGGHKISILGLRSLVKNRNNDLPLHVYEIGCGGGNNLRVIKNWCDKNEVNAVFTGIDINPHAIAYAKDKVENSGIQFICSDYRLAEFEQMPDIIYSSLFCHHFTDEQLVEMLQWCASNTKKGFFINDLHRNPVAYHSIKILTKFFSKSYLVKNDAPVSVLRGFRKAEWKVLLKAASIKSYKVRWKWAFRWLVEVNNQSNGISGNL